MGSHHAVELAKKMRTTVGVAERVFSEKLIELKLADLLYVVVCSRFLSGVVSSSGYLILPTY